MFRLLDTSTTEIEVTMDGETVAVPAGISVAAALLLLDRLPTRVNLPRCTPRAPHCMMGACFECLLEIDGIERRACQVTVQAGMRLQRLGVDADNEASA